MNISQVEIDKLVREVSDKRVVLLGESAHGIREQNLNRFEIITRVFLCPKMNYRTKKDGS